MTSHHSYDVVGIGNALVDVLVNRDESFLDEHHMVKGSMTLIGEDRAETLYRAMGGGLEVSGGSLANSIAGVASFGGRAAYLGRVRDDALGAVFAHDMQASGVHFATKPAADGPPTGRSLIVVTQGGERTMNTYLGASELFGPDQVDRELITDAQVTFLEGYLFDRPESKEAYWAASEIAHSAGRQVALTLSDLFCVERHRDDWLELVHDRVDILFANEAEAQALWRCDDVESAVERTREQVSVGCITLGEKGSIVIAGDETYEIAAEPADLVDTTGAGDLYAAGFLFGYTQGRPLPECGRLGSVAAAAVIGHLGARPEVSLRQFVL